MARTPTLDGGKCFVQVIVPSSGSGVGLAAVAGAVQTKKHGESVTNTSPIEAIEAIGAAKQP
jgi:hypothetical protein